MTKKKLPEKYREGINFVSRNGKSDIIILSNISSTLTEAWYNERKVSKADEADIIWIMDIIFLMNLKEAEI